MATLNARFKRNAQTKIEKTVITAMHDIKNT